MIRGGGHPKQAMVLNRFREWVRRRGASPPMRMTASWSGRYGPTEYKVVARLIRAPERGLPSDRHPDRIERAAVLGAVKVGLASAERVERLVGRPTFTAPARAGFAILRVGNKETDQKSKKDRCSETA